MTVLTDLRHGIADALRTALPDVAVWACPPPNPVPPCLFVLAGAIERVSGCLFDSTFAVEIVGPSGDNEAGVVALESICETVLRVLLAELPTGRVTAGAPDTATLGGAQLLAQTIGVRATVNLQSIVSPIGKVA